VVSLTIRPAPTDKLSKLCRILLTELRFVGIMIGSRKVTGVLKLSESIVEKVVTSSLLTSPSKLNIIPVDVLCLDFPN
jgi:hypothetical protein